MTSETTSKPSSFPAIDPGYLMLAVYVFGVTVLVLLGWLGSAGAGSESNAALEQLSAPVAVVQLQR
ncbi:hypothetical protein [Candidatus Electronema sp. PJ]|uniref:hypothetical protein n=1 Tax=Candidatus Electronema sp. PJ TaxID=3401572 RepID=UPI003AA92E50